MIKHAPLLESLKKKQTKRLSDARAQTKKNLSICTSVTKI